MTEEAVNRRKRLDHERYMRHREERKKRQRAYYIEHREELLEKVRQRRLGIYEKPVLTESQRKSSLENKRERDRLYQRTRRAKLRKDNPSPLK